MKFTKYAVVNSKIHSLMSHLLKEEDYRELVAKRSVVEIIRYLKEKTVYSEILEDKNIEDIHRRELEILIRNKRLRIIKQFIHFFHEPERGLTLLLLRKFEIENLKLAIRNALTSAKEDERDISTKFYNLGNYATFDPARVATSNSIDEILDILRDTPYHTEIRNILESYKGTDRNLVYILETALDKWHLTSIRKHLNKLSLTDRRGIMETIGKQIDLMNTEWIIRAKRFYNLSPEELFNSLIHIGYKLKLDYLRLACDTKGVQEAIEFFSGSYYRDVFEGLEDNKNLSSQLTQRIQRYIYKSITSGRVLREFSLSKLLEYLFMLEFEFSDIILITEAIRYSLNKEEIIKYLIRPLEI